MYSSNTMYGSSTVTSKGQTTIPQDLRLMLNIFPGDRLYFEGDLLSKTIKVKKASKSLIAELYGSLKTNMPYEDINIVRQKAGFLLGKKYSVSK